MSTLPGIIKQLRKEQKLPLRIVADAAAIDLALLSKIERGLRRPTRDQVLKLAAYYKVNEKELLTAWLSEKLIDELEDEELALQALQAAEENVTYRTKPASARNHIINSIKTVLKNDGRVAAAWLFGSYARGEEKPGSDVDIMVELNSKKKYSMFDLLDISFLVEKSIRRKVDLVEKGCLEDFAMKTASADLIKIYG